MSEADVQVYIGSETSQPTTINQSEVSEIESPLTEITELEQLTSEAPGRGGDLWLYRERTVGLLRKYFCFSIEVGRLPSLLGRELFRARVSSYSASTFEDAVIFVHDVEHCLEDLDEFDRRIIGKVVFQDYTQDEAAQLLHCGRRTITRRVPEILDLISEQFLEHGLLHRLPAQTSIAPESCQEGKSGQFLVSDCCQGENNFKNVAHFPP